MQQGTALMTPETVLPLLNDPRLEALTDSALKHLFAVQFRLGIADPPDKVRHSQLAALRPSPAQIQSLTNHPLQACQVE